ncbi:hypothetical protein ACIQMR_31315 [Streptomyces sp. NPDC091376]|uniref:non-homologous end-joining DNA ligase LigD n=1 Tax=Streptomyces sp. NPDC091376 TaxID=3365994 RepID=UPI003804D40F
MLLTTGSRGLHVIVPLSRHSSYDEVRDFAQDTAELLGGGTHPELPTTEVRKAARGDRLYLDGQRNEYAQSAVAHYSVRARDGAPVATPIGWDQLDDPKVTARRWSIDDVAEQAAADPWARCRGQAAARRVAPGRWRRPSSARTSAVTNRSIGRTGVTLSLAPSSSAYGESS